MSEIRYDDGSTLAWTGREYSWGSTWTARVYNWGYDYSSWTLDRPLRISDYYVSDSISSNSGIVSE